ncbi:hypothetical protein IMY05_C4401001600 [Salix suchowensis]|nr:hypothetical protein IMY05_C4401001600 [Salix suchowensis]
MLALIGRTTPSGTWLWKPEVATSQSHVRPLTPKSVDDTHIWSEVAFSQYILSTKRLCDPLTSAEAWSHLRDSMLLILSQQFLQEEAALALIAAPVICQALCLILLNNDQAERRRADHGTISEFCGGAVRRPHRLKSGSESSSTVTAICEVDDRIRQIADISTIHYIQKAFGSILLKSHREEFVVGGTANPAISRLTATSDGVEARSSQRRRSQTTTATTSHAPRRTIDDAYRAATKRAHRPRTSSSSSFSDDSSSSNWDLDIWRQAKRRRRDSLVSRFINYAACTYHSDESSLLKPSVRNGSHMDIDHFTTMPSTSSGATVRRTTLPSTSIAFQLFPMTGRRTTKTRRSSCQSDSGDIALNDRDTDLRGLRTSAFWELHRSIAESGEGFVRRMQDLESSLSQPDILSKGGNRH